jgi:hypothetical protein
MQINKLGCFTATGIFATLLALLAIVGMAFTSGSQMFTAGSLNAQTGDALGGVTSHAQIAKCSACHTAPWATTRMADRCAACHTDIATQMFDVAKLHGMITKKSPALECRVCHPDHRGPSALLTDLSGNTFPHEALGFKLEGKHASVKCDQCHINNVYKDTPADCYSCHKQNDEHKGQFGNDCGACHDSSDWKKATFDHNLSAFKLEGKHASVKCDQCHVNNVFKGTPTDCYSCHKQNDEHDGKFGTDCSTCHSLKSWDDAIFDHSKSNFALTGAHVKVACERCHENGKFKGLDTACVSCHAEPAAHMGQFGTDCVACHSTDAWTPASFNGKHAFPLNHGEGGTVSCATCHPANYTTYTCYGCHEHTEARISAKHLEEGISNFQNCVECHADGSKHDGGD